MGKIGKTSNMNKKGIEFGFGWIFAIIVGAVIIFLAIYAANSFVKTGRQAQDVSASKELGILLTPIETSVEDGKMAPTITFPSKARIYNTCRREGNFGAQRIGISTQLGIGNQFEEPDIQSTFYNKYIFSNNIEQGKRFFVFSKPLNMPFKIADLLYLWSEEDYYCFVSPPEDVEEEMNALSPKNFNITSLNNCPDASKKVCFGTGDVKCDILVSYDSYSPEKGVVTIKGQSLGVNYQNYALMYAAIFSDNDMYECQVERLMKRASSLALIYKDKIDSVSSRANGCGSAVQGEMLSYIQITSETNKSSNLDQVSLLADSIGRANENLVCQIF